MVHQPQFDLRPIDDVVDVTLILLWVFGLVQTLASPMGLLSLGDMDFTCTNFRHMIIYLPHLQGVG